MALPMKISQQEETNNLNEAAIKVPGRCCFNRPLNIDFGSKNNLAIHGLGDSQRAGSPPHFTEEVSINELRCRQEYDVSVARALINEMSSVFLSNQRPPASPMTTDEILHYSRSYRAVIKIAIKETQKIIESPQNSEFIEDLMREFVVSESAWSFAEIIFFQEPHGGELVGQLLSWIQNQINDCQLMVEEVLRAQPIESHENYWPTVFGCLLQGRVNETVMLLQSVNKRSKPQQVVVEAVRKMPLFQTQGMSLFDFKLKWQQWQQEVQQLFDQGVFYASEELTQVAQILLGDRDTLLMTGDSLGLSWYSQLIAQLLYTQPFAKLYNVQDSMNAVIDHSGGTAAFELHDHLIHSILKKSLIDIMKFAGDGFSSWWFPAHFSDVFYQAGHLREKNSVGTSMREHLILELAGSMMQNESLWSVGAQYLLHCPDLGRYHLQEYISRISLTSTKKAMKVVNLCEQNGFTQQASSICRIMARRDLKEDRLGSALMWCKLSKDSNMATIIAERFLELYRQQNVIHSADVLDNLGSSMLISKKLLFLAKFREFHQLCDNGEEREACSLLATLITSRMAPIQYWFLLLMELLPMLESAKILFTTAQIYDLMNAVTELEQSQSHEMVSEIETNRVHALQLALTRCLARVTLSDSDAFLGISCDKL